MAAALNRGISEIIISPTEAQVLGFSINQNLKVRGLHKDLIDKVNIKALLTVTVNLLEIERIFEQFNKSIGDVTDFFFDVDMVVEITAKRKLSVEKISCEFDRCLSRMRDINRLTGLSVTL